jgi:hypothetical protein
MSVLFKDTCLTLTARLVIYRFRLGKQLSLSLLTRHWFGKRFMYVGISYQMVDEGWRIHYAVSEAASMETEVLEVLTQRDKKSSEKPLNSPQSLLFYPPPTR